MHSRRRRSTRGLVLLALCVLASGCAAQPAKDRPFRSPTRDYPPPPAQTSDGEVVGADRIAPADKLQTGPSNDGLAPGWSLDGGPHYHPGDKAGGQTDRGPHDEHNRSHGADEDADSDSAK
jgi:hypothetical protein